MSVNEILAELDTLSPDELNIIREKLYSLDADTEETPEMLAAVDEGLRSLREEGSVPIDDVIKESATWKTKSP